MADGRELREQERAGQESAEARRRLLGRGLLDGERWSERSTLWVGPKLSELCSRALQLVPSQRPADAGLFWEFLRDAR
ncbi:MAG TPA: hypothetical protein DEA08_19455 [Planctomycetes bacterium]|nr:hypothetical protein [Planctomycetota bacterium]